MSAIATAEASGELYVQDFSYLREACGLAPDEELTSGPPKAHFWEKEPRFGGAPVSLSYLSDLRTCHKSALKHLSPKKERKVGNGIMISEFPVPKPLLSSVNVTKMIAFNRDTLMWYC